MTTKEKLLSELSRCVVEGNAEECKAVAAEALNQGVDAYEAIMHGCAEGMNIMGARYETHEAFVPELLMSAEAMNAAIEILRPHLKADTDRVQATVLLGTVEGDIHDIGKNLVKILLDAAGYRVIDLGKDVPLNDFVERAKQEDVDIIGLSSLVSSTMPGMKKVIEMLAQAGLRDKVKVIVGGAVTTPEFAESAGADGYGKDAVEAVKITRALLLKK